MPITFTVTHTDRPEASDDYAFAAERVTIGRGNENTLVLPDPKRVVSKEHAVVVQVAGGYELTDLGSTNLTYLNGEPLDARRPHPLHDGDTVAIGDFQLRCAVTAPAEPSADQTMLDGKFLNPFLDDAAVLSATLRSMARTYEGEPVARRTEALVQAIRTAEEESEEGGGASPVLALVGAAFVQAFSNGASASGSEGAGTPAAPATSERVAAPVAGVAAPNARTVEAMVRALARVLSIPQHFRLEFIGQTIVQGPDDAPLYAGDAEALRRHLLQSDLPEEEERERALHLQEAADLLAAHHVAMLEGYRASVREGVAKLLEQLDPETAKGEGEKASGLGRMLPGARKAKAAEHLIQQFEALRGDDWAVAERRVFRPVFIKAYLARAEPDDRRGGDTGSRARRGPSR